MAWYWIVAIALVSFVAGALFVSRMITGSLKRAVTFIIKAIASGR